MGAASVLREDIGMIDVTSDSEPSPPATKARPRGISIPISHSLSVIVRALTASSVLMALSSGFAAAQPVSKPNIILIGVDDMADCIAGLAEAGYPTAHTPNLDRLIKRGIAFTQAYCVSPVCGPSRAAVLTGLRPETSRVYGNVGTYLNYASQAVAFPEYLRKHGYHVMGAGKINHLPSKEFEATWDEYGPGTGIVGTPFKREELLQANFKPTLRVTRPDWEVTLPLNGILAKDRASNEYATFDWGPLPVGDDDMPDGKIAGWAVQQLSREFDRPFFLAVGFYKPHLPWFAPKRCFELNPLSRIHRPPTIDGDLDDLSQTGKDYARLVFTAGSHDTVLASGKWEKAIQGYLACISFADAQIGRILDALEKSPYARNTIVIFWSDHGFLLGEKQHWGKYAPWTRTTRVPFIIAPTADSLARQPGLAGSRCSAFVSLLDLYPTLIDLAGLPPKPGLEGASIARLIEQPGAASAEAIVTTTGRGTHSIRYQDWHYIHYFDGTEELYELKSDPNEWRNVAGDERHMPIKSACRRFIVVDPAIRQYIRCKQWKAVAYKSGAVELYDLYADRGIAEEKNVASQHPEVVAEITRLAATRPTETFVNLADP
jgi:arylsulfatase A-like enzyme